MVKHHSDRERGNLLPPHGLLFPISNEMHHSTDRITHTTAFVTPVMDHWLEHEIAWWAHYKDPLHHGRTLLPRSYVLLLTGFNAEEEANT